MILSFKKIAYFDSYENQIILKKTSQKYSNNHKTKY